MALMKLRTELGLLAVCLTILATQWLPASLWFNIRDLNATYVGGEESILLDFNDESRLTTRTNESFSVMRLDENGSWVFVCDNDFSAAYTPSNTLRHVRVVNCGAPLEEGVYMVVGQFSSRNNFLPRRETIVHSNTIIASEITDGESSYIRSSGRAPSSLSPTREGYPADSRAARTRPPVETTVLVSTESD